MPSVFFVTVSQFLFFRIAEVYDFRVPIGYYNSGNIRTCLGM